MSDFDSSWCWSRLLLQRQVHDELKESKEALSMEAMDRLTEKNIILEETSI